MDTLDIIEVVFHIVANSIKVYFDSFYMLIAQSEWIPEIIKPLPITQMRQP